MRSLVKSVGTVSAALAALGSSATMLARPAAAQDPAQPPVTPPPAASSEKPTASAPAPSPIAITGNVEANYTYNFNRPRTGSNVYLYNTNEGQFSLNLLDVHIGRQATDASRVGFLVRLIEGEVKRRNFNPGEYGTTDNPNVLEAYGTFLVPAKGRDIKVDVGQFVTHVGYETIEIGTNNFFSRNWLFQYPSPFYDAGIRASYPVSDKFTLSGYIYNRFNGVYDPDNRDLAPGFQLAYNPSARTGIILNGLGSRENISVLGPTATPALNKPQNVLDLIITQQFTPSFKGVVEGLYRWGKDAGTYDPLTSTYANDSRKYDVGGVAGYGIFTLKNGNTLSLRGEYVSASKVTNLTALSSVTGSYELHSGLFPGLRTLLEYRYDVSGSPLYFATNSGNGGTNNTGFHKNQSTITIGQVYSF